MSTIKKLPHTFYERDTVEVAKALLGKYLVHHVNGIERIGKIVEVEAYLGAHDLACHSSRGLTKRTEVMFGPAGYAYVYLIYGLYHCLNVVTERAGQGSAVLLRALEPIQNIESRTQGPGLLWQGMDIDKRLNGCDLLGDELFLLEKEALPPCDIIEKPRIGVDYAKEWTNKLLRFYIKNNTFVSKK